MKTIPASIADKLVDTNDVTQFALLFTVVGKDSVTRRFTNHDIGIMYNGNRYASWNGFTHSAIFSGLGTNTASVTVSFLLDEYGDDDLIGISSIDIRRGYMDGALCTIDFVDWNQQNFIAPLNGAHVRLFSGESGVVKILDDNFASMEIQTRSMLGNDFRNEVYSVNCRAAFGDERCKYPIDDVKRVALEVETVVDQNNFTFVDPGDLTAEELTLDYWRNGLIVWTTGNNILFPVEIISSGATDQSVKLWLRAPFPIVVGDEFTMYPGCDKVFHSGCTRWDNKLNFRGEPFTGVALPSDSVVTEETTEPGTNDVIPSAEEFLPIGAIR